MEKFDGWSAVGYTALGAMCLVWMWAGWHILLEGGFYHTPRHAKASTYVDGAGAAFMSFLFLSLAAICTAVILKRLNAPRAASAATSAAILGLPMAYLARQFF